MTKPQNVIFTTPHYLTLYVEKVGAPAAADALGMHPSYINKALRDDKCRPSLDLAARYLFEKLDGKSKQDLWIVRPEHHAEMLQTMFKSLNIRFTKLRD